MGEQIVVPIGISVNGEDRELMEPLTIAELLGTLNMPTKGIAVAVNGEVFPRARWDETVIRGWEIEIVTAVQGG
ncbi:thiamine biosynthesis protein ThiS [Rhodococcus sp. WMMA185]|uniref:sulfur carrier protein ThiS n=1 Tax=Rhodococcus sp. WMMA185 TaxID=679318 RepID=UPI000877FF5B|nr:sulfur carrier protein ThiS [Rhodococcus sp. WMMA185]AOW93289.1 thiamine biosynthesis protein ThiS [Rhodococcus sp. WMMA185]